MIEILWVLRISYLSISGRDLKNIIDLDLATRAALAAKIEIIDRRGGKVIRMNRSQVGNLIETLWSSPDHMAIEVLIIYIVRQAGRKLIGRYTSKYLIQGLKKIESSVNDPTESKALAAIFLNIFKWIYESLDMYEEIPSEKFRWNEIANATINFDDFINRLIQSSK